MLVSVSLAFLKPYIKPPPFSPSLSPPSSRAMDNLSFYQHPSFPHDESRPRRSPPPLPPLPETDELYRIGASLQVAIDEQNRHMAIPETGENGGLPFRENSYLYSDHSSLENSFARLNLSPSPPPPSLSGDAYGDWFPDASHSDWELLSLRVQSAVRGRVDPYLTPLQPDQSFGLRTHPIGTTAHNLDYRLGFFHDSSNSEFLSRTLLDPEQNGFLYVGADQYYGRRRPSPISSATNHGNLPLENLDRPLAHPFALRASASNTPAQNRPYLNLGSRGRSNRGRVGVGRPDSLTPSSSFSSPSTSSSNDHQSRRSWTPRPRRSYASLEELRGKIAEAATDLGGCRFLQKKIAEGGAEAISVIFPELMGDLDALMVSQSGNKLILELLKVCNEAQITEVLGILASKIGRAHV